VARSVTATSWSAWSSWSCSPSPPSPWGRDRSAAQRRSGSQAAVCRGECPGRSPRTISPVVWGAAARRAT